MKKPILTSAIISLLFFTHIYAANEKFETVFYDDFENPESVFKKCAESPDICYISSSNAISGEKSLVLDSRHINKEWILYAKLEGTLAKKGRSYLIEFDYNLIESREQSAENYFSIRGSDGTFYGREMFAITQGQKGKAKMYFVVPASAKDPKFQFSTRNPSLTIIDNLSIKEFDVSGNAWLFEPNTFIGMRKSPVHQNMLMNDPTNPAYLYPREKFMPFVDKYGQYKHTNWDCKISGKDALKETIKKEEAYNKSRPDIENRDSFGGLANSAGDAPKTKGFTVCKVDDKWYFRDPDGNLFWSSGITTVGMFPSTPITDREEYFEELDPSYVVKSRGFKPGTYYDGKNILAYEFTRKNVTEKYGTTEVYPEVVGKRMRKWGLNTCGAWTTKEVALNSGIPFTACINSAGASKLNTQKKLWVLWGGISDWFDPAFKIKTEENAAKHAEILSHKNCIGAFIDNELSWQHTPGITALAVLSCPATQPAKIEFQKMLKKKYDNIEDLNKAWGSTYTNWDDFLNNRDFEPKTKKSEKDVLKFETLYYEQYFKVCKNALRKVSPKSLYLGCRLASKNELVERTAFKICDVVSYNIYKRDLDHFKRPSKSKDKPVIIGEFHICRTNKGSPYGGLLEVPNAEESAKAYINYMESAARHPSIVGAHWFQWFDMIVTGRGDGANATCGFISVTDEPDYTLADASRKFATEMYDIRAKAKAKNKK